MKGEKTPCIPSLVPVVQLAQPGKLFGRIVDLSGALGPSFISRDKTGSRPALASGLMISNVAPSRPMMTVFIRCLRCHRLWSEVAQTLVCVLFAATWLILCSHHRLKSVPLRLDH